MRQTKLISAAARGKRGGCPPLVGHLGAVELDDAGVVGAGVEAEPRSSSELIRAGGPGGLMRSA